MPVHLHGSADTVVHPGRWDRTLPILSKPFKKHWSWLFL